MTDAAADHKQATITDPITREFKSQIPTPPSKESSQEKILAYASDRLKAAENAERKAREARERAEACDDPEEKKRILVEAEREERKSKAEMKAVNRVQSGVWQGAGMGGGMGAGLGMGIGAGVGTLLGGVVSIPTTGVGLLAGAATGAIHGPWFKLPGGEGMKENREGGEGEGGEEGIEGGKEGGG
ncbi:hypothetical protein EG329_009156 [Mollisiaceae sp. DMI_Dod_QoI]|nr:hypothetical protein EG329_009156 [Helotiales sp. DMI_Dod_QoI]